jgi:cell division protein FtsZ
MGVLVHFHIHPNFPLTQIQAAMEIIYDSADEDADVIFGTTTNESFSENEVKITIVATGFDAKEEILPANTVTTTVIEEVAQAPQVKAPQRRKISGGGDYIDSTDLDYPTFLRRQMD